MLADGRNGLGPAWHLWGMAHAAPVRPQVQETNEFIRYCQIREKIEEKPFSINILTVLKTVRKIGMVNGECRKNTEFLYLEGLIFKQVIRISGE